MRRSANIGSVTRCPVFVTLMPLLLLSAACGVEFSEDESGTEFFKELTISGERRAGAPLTVSAFYEQFYPVDLDVSCELRQGNALIKPIGNQTVAAVPDGSPDATPVVGHVTFDFTVGAPGPYKVECLTPKDENNFIQEEIVVSE